MIMNHNVGGIDRVVRILTGLLLMVLSFYEIIGPWGYLGAIVTATGVFKYCLMYSILGLSTCPAATDSLHP
jgi:heme O synthase-like polyprenyltransferase